MTYAISSAEPSQLFRYRDFGFRVENELATEANRLGGVLRRFEATCTEYRVPVSHLADQLHGYANWAEDVDRFVGVVGLNFLVADSSTALARLIEDVVLKIHETVGGALLAISIRPGSTYLEQININLPNVLPKVSIIRRVFEISPTHIKYTNLLKKIGRPGPIVVVLTVVVISLKWYNDIVMYQRGDYTGTQLASALTADLVLTLVPTGAAIVGAIAGAKIGGVVGTMIAPGPGTAIGAVIGGIVGSIAFGWGTDAALDHVDAREKMIPGLDERVFQPAARVIADFSQDTVGFVDAAGARMRQSVDAIREAAQLGAARLQRDISQGANEVIQQLGGAIDDVSRNIRTQFETMKQGANAVWQEANNVIESTDISLKLAEILAVTKRHLVGVEDRLAPIVSPPRSPIDYRIADIDHAVRLVRQSKWTKIARNIGSVGLALDIATLPWRIEDKNLAYQTWKEAEGSRFEEATWRRYQMARLEALPVVGDELWLLYAIVRPPIVYAPELEMTPQVLGVSTESTGGDALWHQRISEEYTAKPWRSLWGIKQELESKIAEVHAQIGALTPRNEELGRELIHLKQGQAALEDYRRELQEQIKSWRNQLARSEEGWRLGFDDGLLDAPYRTKADDLEDRALQLDKTLTELDSMIASTEQNIGDVNATLTATNSELAESRERLDVVRTRIEHGLQVEGSTKNSVLVGLGGCTYYVAQKRNLDDWHRWPHAHAWDEEAKKAGYEVDKLPLKGAIIVYEKGAKYYSVNDGVPSEKVSTVNGTYGHVAFVEDVQWSVYPDRVRLRISEGNYNGKMGSAGKVNLDRWIEIDSNQLKDISFIYDKPKKLEYVL